jgi:iron complex outermembrane receptor protein
MTMRHRAQRVLLSAGASLAALTSMSGAAWAQDTSGVSRADEIVVTAGKREQTLQDAPISVSVVDNDIIEQSEIQDLIDLQSVVPSLQVQQIQLSSQTNFIIRGFGNGANNAGIEPSVGVFIDGVYRSRSSSSLSDLPPVERVEILRGPQSTLFGKNASAGVVSIVTQAPEDETGGSLEAGYGNFNAMRLSGDVTGPLSDGVAYRLFGSYNQRDGYVDDLNTGDQINDRNRYALRGQLLFEPAEYLSIRVIADYDYSDELCCTITNLINGPTGPVVNALGGVFVPEDPFSYDVANTYSTLNENEIAGLSAQIDLNLGAVTATSISAIRRTDTLTQNDVDLSTLDLLAPNPNTTLIDTITQEIRFTSNDAGRVDWMIGGFFFREEIEITDRLIWGKDGRAFVGALLGARGASVALLEGALGATPGSFFGAGQGINERSGQENTTWSLFGTLDFHLTDQLTASFGLNHTRDEKDVYHQIDTTDVYSQIDLNPLVPVLGQSAVSTLQSIQIFPQFLAFPNVVEDGQTRDEQTTYSARLAYDITESLNVYVSMATGFKASSWNLSRDSRPFASSFPGIVANGLLTTNLASGTRFAGPETSEVFEIGLKGSFDSVRFSLTYFEQSIEDFQTFVFLGTGFGLSNAGERSTTGVEFDVTWYPTDNLTLGFASTFLDPVYDSFPDSSFGDLSGATPAQVPETSISITGAYEFTLAGLEAYVRADYQHQSESAFEDDVVLDRIVGARYSNELNLVNASLGVEFGEGWSGSVWGRNIFDDQAITFAFPTPLQSGSYTGIPSQPATYGVTLRKAF